VQRLFVTLLSITAAGATSAATEPSRQFESEIRPLLVQRCHKCHGATVQKGKLRLDSRSAALAGGENGPAVVPGKPQKSLLVDAINHGSREMPPDGKLSEAQIASLTRWIEQGAVWPGDDQPPVAAVRRGPKELTEADRQWWSFQPVKRPAAPEITSDWPLRNDVDRFVAARLQAEKLHSSPEADKHALLRRATFDLHGLPPTPEETAAFLAHDAPQAYEKLIDRLLDSPRYGERWARHWLDLVRYAESDGYKQDDFRPTAWRYRDYVIQSLNDDKPYDRFVQEQLAGDEISPDDPQAVVATAYLQLGIYEYNQRDVPTQWHSILNEITDVTADVFLGQGLQCARCHDHKYDPLLQKDYFRLRAYFAAYSPLTSAPVASLAEQQAYREKLTAWEQKTADLRRELNELQEPARAAVANDAMKKFPDDMRAILEKPADQRSTQERQLYDLAWRQIVLETDKIDYSKKLTGDALLRWQELKAQLAAFESEKPQPLPTTIAGSDIGPDAPPTLIPGKQGEAIEPGPPSVFDPRPAIVPTPTANATTTGRRRALAEWIANENNPLTSRVLVNRVWQYHFGRGLVNTSSDFGHLGELPSHPELLDYLASEFVASGWSLKKLHRLIMTSHAYRQASKNSSPETAAKDPQNRLLWRQSVRRLDAEQIRDAILAATGELDLVSGGPSVDVKAPRRTIFTKQFRNRRDPLLDVFDVPDGIASTPQRNVTTTPLQSLLLINNPWMLERAKVLAAKVNQDSPDDAALVDRLYLRILARPATAGERQTVVRYLAAGNRQEALADVCHALLNSSEFLFVD
jgi:cytochrome c553